MNQWNMAIRSAISGFIANKARALLTTVSILIGMLSILLLLSLGQGLRKYIRDQFATLSSNVLYVLPGKIDSAGGLVSSSLVTTLFDKDDLKKVTRAEGVSLTVPTYIYYGDVSSSYKTKLSEVHAATEDIFTILSLKVHSGRFFSHIDVTKASKYAVLGYSAATKLFETTDHAMGKSIRIDDLTFKVIGIADQKGAAGAAPSMDDHIYIPLSSISSMNPRDEYYAFYVLVDNSAQIPKVKEKLTQILGKKYDDDQFSVAEQGELLNAVDQIIGMINATLVGIAAISLVVAGAGIMSIMYVTVAERTAEIGIRRAVGATRTDILLLFLSEAVLVSLFGAGLSLIAALMIIAAIQPLFPAALEAETIVLSLLVCVGVGLLFGIFPAQKAASLTPVEAIRHE